MFINQIERKRVYKGKFRLRFLIRGISFFILVGFVLFVFASLWLVPGVVQQEVKKRLSGLSEGAVSIEHVQLSYMGQIVIKGIQFYDKTKQPWLLADKTTITLKNWPSLHPAIEIVQIDGLDLRLATQDGRLILPVVHRPGPLDKQDKKLSLDKLTINRAVLTIRDANGVGVAYEDVTLSVTGETNGDYEFVLSKASGKGPEVLVAEGTINVQSTEFNISLQVNHKLTKMENKVAFAALDVPNASAEGGLAANLKVTGSLKRPSEIQSSGSIKLSQYTIFFQERILANDLILAAQLDGQRLAVNEFTATVCDGSIDGTFHAEIRDERSIEYQGQVLATDVNYPELTSILSSDKKKAASGSFNCNYGFSGRQNDPNALRGEGMIFLNDIDVSILPVIPTIFKFIGLSRIEPLKTSDTEAKFHNAGSVVTIDSGHISNLFAAIEFEPGGTVDLKTEQIDTYVVAAPLSKITGIIEQLPIIDIFANLKDKLIRLQVKGNWSDPPSKLISKTPIKDIKDSTIGFIQDTARTGGQFGKGMLDLIGGVLKTNKNKNK
jgi:hypothetical protein